MTYLSAQNDIRVQVSSNHNPGRLGKKKQTADPAVFLTCNLYSPKVNKKHVIPLKQYSRLQSFADIRNDNFLLTRAMSNVTFTQMGLGTSLFMTAH